MRGGFEIAELAGQWIDAPGFSISIVIPSWNGLHLLEENLPSIRDAAAHYEALSGAPVEIIVVDDGSTDDTVAEVGEIYPEIRLIVHSRNRGFAAACNSGIQASCSDLVALLNNDVQVSREYFLYKALHFVRPDVFAVSARVFEWDEPIFTTGGRIARFRRGFWSVYFNYDVNTDAREWVDACRLLSFYAIAGFATFSRSKLIELGGFDELLTPFHWEDVDLSYRGWKRGWEVHYEPRSRARHRTSATIEAHFKKKHVDAVSFRNRLLFHWINIHSKSYFWAHLLSLGFLFCTKFLVLDRYFYRSLFEALAQYKRVLERRRAEKSHARLTDDQVWKKLKAFYEEAPIQIYYNQQEVIESHPEYS